MKILLLNLYYAPDEAATAQMLADLGEALAAAGHDVTAICGDRSYADPKERYPKRQTIGGVRVRRIVSSGFGRASRVGRVLDYATFFAGAAVHVFRRRYDVIVFLSTPPLIGLLAIAAGRASPHPPTPSPAGEGVPKAGVRSVFWSMDVYPELAFELGAMRRGSLAGRITSRLSRLILNKSDTVVALGPEMANKLEEQAPLAPRREAALRDPEGKRIAAEGRGGSANGAARNATPRITFIHNWADGEAIRPRPIEGHPLRRSRGWEGRFVVLYSGNMGMAHDFETVLAAAALLRDRSEVLFAFAGTGPMLGRVRREAGERHLSNIEFRDSVPRSGLGESLTAGEVHLVTLREGMEGLLVPSKIYGILAAGRPVLYVGPEAGEVFEIVTGGECGTVVRNGDAHRLAAEIEAYARDRERRELEGKNARALFEHEYSKEKALGEWIALIERREGVKT